MSIDQSKLSRKERGLFFAWRWLAPVWDPLFTVRGLREWPRFARTWRQYARMRGAEPIGVENAYPQLHDRTARHAFDAHYFYVNSWAMRRVVARAPDQHVDIASQPILSALLSSVVPVEFLDYRPLTATLSGLTCSEGNLLELPYETDSLMSVSCLHVAEHIGLGRYGDELDPFGTAKACQEIARVLGPGGHVYFAVPIGKPRLCFNAHRIHGASTILSYFSELILKEFTVVRDDGCFVENADITSCDGAEYALGMFLLQKPK